MSYRFICIFSSSLRIDKSSVEVIVLPPRFKLDIKIAANIPSMYQMG